MDNLAERKAVAEERLKAAEARRAARAKPAELAEIERLEREAAEAEAIAEAEAEYGPLDEEIKVVRSPRGIVIVKRPIYVAVKQFVNAGKSTVEAQDKIGRPLVVYPSAAAYAEMTSNDVSIIVAVANAALWLAGFGRTKLEEKSEA